MELELGLALPNHNSTTNNAIKVETKLSLLLRNGGHRLRPDQSNDDGRHPKSRRVQVNHDSSDVQEIEAGWQLHRRHGGLTAAEQMRNSMYVKVKMEGVAIGRKIDLANYHSYQDLTNTLINMFAKYNKTEKYVLMYQNKERDWMLVGDVQWERFVECAQRLEIIKKDNKIEFQLLSTVKYT